LEDDSRSARNRTLELLGATPDDNLRVLVEAPPDESIIAVKYQEVNDLLGPMVERDPNLPIRHLTGEARVLKDPAHRRILRQSTNAKLGCSVKDHDGSAWSFFAHATRYWSDFDWFDLVDTLDLAARGKIEICLLDEPETIHFSVFGDQFVLLQDRHEHPQAKKWVWYIESSNLVMELVPRVKSAFEAATPLDRLGFLAILEWLYDYDTANTVRQLALQRESVEFDSLDPQIADRLLTLRFVERNTRGLVLMPRAREWFADLQGRELAVSS
jgi:hypothetical protein